MKQILTDNKEVLSASKSSTPSFRDILISAQSRRTILKGGLASAAVFLGARSSTGQGISTRPDRAGLTDFRPVTRSQANRRTPYISPDYRFQVILPWGEPIKPDGPAFEFPSNATDQESQIGIGHDGLWYFPDRDSVDLGNRRGLLAINHEFGTNLHVFGNGDPESLDDVRLSQHAHGVSIVGILRENGVWRTYEACSARRIHVNTAVNFSGPAADSALLTTPNGNSPQGTLNNCGCGVSPWETYLTCEENFQGYFGATGTEWTQTSYQQRYGFSSGGFGYGWHVWDRRFNLADSGYENEENRFGWVVEIDPYDANHVPVKRTALGRFKHESVATTIGKDRRVVAYMGDDEANEHIYKFVGSQDYIRYLNAGESPLDYGRLYVARFNDDFTGEWLELNVESDTLADSFESQAEVLVYARSAATLLGATPMDRPEWTTVAPDGSVYCALTNNSGRTESHPANPQAPNPDGHIIRIIDDDMHVGLTFEWEIFQLASDTHETEESYSDPDSILCDPEGRLFIGTDGTQQENMNNQLLVADTVAKDVKRLFSGVPSCEVTGITMTPNRRTMFVNIQHPGNGVSSVSDFPRLNGFRDSTVPRDATVVIYRRDGGIVGS